MCSNYSNTVKPVYKDSNKNPIFLKMCFVPNRMHQFQMSVIAKKYIEANSVNMKSFIATHY